MKHRRALGPLTRKLLRDLREGWKSFVAIWMICMLAVTLYVGIDATWRSMQQNLDAQFERSNLSDLWVSGAVSDRTVRDIEAIPGVNVAQRRLSVYAAAKELEGEPTVQLIMSEGEPVVNRPLVYEGEGFSAYQKNQCVLQRRFAEAQGLQVGDTFRVTYAGEQIDLAICGLGILPEYVVTHDGDEFAPGATKFGYAYVSPGTLGHLSYTEVTLTLQPGADVKTVRLAVQTLLDDQQTVVSERDDIFGIKMASEEAQQLKALGTIFPVVFFIIAALITWTTMSRLVENQRLQIGTLFALGYGRGELIRHYTSYGLIIAVLGVLGGLAGALFVIAPILLDIMFTIYVLPGATPYLSPWMLGVITALVAVITGGASFLSAQAALKQTPAALLRPKPPGKGKRVFLENMQALWSRIQFSGKMILRNLLRNPVRLLMGLVGAAGCTALLLTGFGLRDSVDYVLSNHYTRTMHYEARVTLEEDAPVDYGRAVALRTGAETFEEEMIASCEAFINGTWTGKQVYVLQDGHDMIRLRDGDGNWVTLPGEGVALTRKAAEDYGLTLGDTLLLRVPGGRAVQTQIVRIVDLQLDQGIYASRSAWAQLDLFPWQPTAVLLRGDSLNLTAARDMDGVSKVRTLEEERNSNGSVLNIMNLVVVLMVIFSGALDLVVLYNLGQLNFSERIRELATLKVLGFTPREIKKLVLRENIIITFMGLPIGLLLGPGLHELVLDAGLPKTIQFVPYISLESWIITCVLTICFAMLVNWILGTKFKEVNMVEALKSVE